MCYNIAMREDFVNSNPDKLTGIKAGPNAEHILAVSTIEWVIRERNNLKHHLRDPNVPQAEYEVADFPIYVPEAVPASEQAQTEG